VIVATTTAALTLSTTAYSNYSWDFEATGTIRSLGSGTGTTNIYFGKFYCPTAMTVTNGFYLFPASAPAVSSGWDCTVTEQVNLEATLSSTGDSITLLDYSLEALN
jgi:hypothetical protein